jgi:hypothetical protein
VKFAHAVPPNEAGTTHRYQARLPDAVVSLHDEMRAASQHSIFESSDLLLAPDQEMIAFLAGRNRLGVIRIADQAEVRPPSPLPTASTAASLVDLVMFVLVGGVVECGGGTISRGLDGVGATRPSAGDGSRAGDIG